MCKTQMTRILNMRMCLQVKHNSQVKCYMDNWRAIVHYRADSLIPRYSKHFVLWEEISRCDARLSEEVFIVVFLELSVFHPHHVKSSVTSQQISYCVLLAVLVKQRTFCNLQKVSLLSQTTSIKDMNIFMCIINTIEHFCVYVWLVVYNYTFLYCFLIHIYDIQGHTKLGLLCLTIQCRVLIDCR